MPSHPALNAGRVAVITGAASGIGLAAARHFASIGMRLCMADLDGAQLTEAAGTIGIEVDKVLIVPTDVSRMAEVERLRDEVFKAFGEVAVLMNNAGTAPGGGPFDNYERWRRVLDVNLFGVIHGVQAFTPAMIAQSTPAAIVNTGSKQGITCPPGDTAYNVSKAGVKVLTEGLAHELRSLAGCRVTAHLLVPGFTFTGMTRPQGAEKPAAAWSPEQVVDRMVERMAAGEFYIICPDNDVTEEIDRRRIRWAADDLVLNRPALSRWHPDYAARFAQYMNEPSDA